MTQTPHLSRALGAIAVSVLLSSSAAGAGEATSDGPAAGSDDSASPPPPVHSSESTAKPVPPAQPQQVVDVQVTGTRVEAPVGDVPQSVTVVGRSVMDSTLARRTDDVMLLVPGTQLGPGYGGTWDDYVIRGFRVWSGTTYRNGFLNGYSGANATDTVNVERIEVIHGPASALYGPALPGGSIRYVTKEPLAEPHSRLRLMAGSFGTLRGELDATGALDDRDHVLARVTAAGEASDGHRDFNDWQRWIANPAVAWRPDAKTSVLGEVQVYRQLYRADPGGVPALGGDAFALPVHRSYIEPDAPMASTFGSLIRVQGTRSVSSHTTLRVAVQSQLGAYRELAVIPIALLDDRRTLVRLIQNWESGSRDIALQASVTERFSTGSLRHLLVTGFDTSTERVDWRVAVSDPATTPYTIDVWQPVYGSPLPDVPLPGGDSNRWSSTLAGVFVNDLMTVLPHLHALVGARVDGCRQTSKTDTVDETEDEWALSARSGLVYEAASWISFYGNVSNGFWPVLGVTSTARLLKPEHSLAYEAGVRTAWERDRLTADVAVFHLTNRNISVPDPDRPDFQVQRGAARSRGVEVLLKAHPWQAVRAIASYAWSDATVSADTDSALVGKPLAFSARHSGAVWAEFGVLGPLLTDSGVAAGAVFTSKRALLDGYEVPGYVRFDAGVFHRAGPVLATIRAENVAGTRYVKSGNGEFALLPGAPRNFMLAVQYDR